MLEEAPSPERLALNRATYGASDNDLLDVQQLGWAGWVQQQINPPVGDDAPLAAYLAQQTLPIKYKADPNGNWAAADEDRPLIHLDQSIEDAWDILNAVKQKVLPGAELARIGQEFVAAHWIRAAHSSYQLREVLVDFWHNHFNISPGTQPLRASVMVYDSAVIRPHVFGNFAEMLEANASSAGMLLYLDNAVSKAKIPNENYARELLELHTLGEAAYYGQDDVPVSGTGIAPGFNDADVINVSKALSGWTLEYGQRISRDEKMPSTGKFVFNPAQHNTTAQSFLNQDLTELYGIAQGQKVLELAAKHEATAEHLTAKLINRFFNGVPSQELHATLIDTWMANQEAPDQLAQVTETLLLSDEFMEQPAAKARRPFEKLVAYTRTTGAQFVANRAMQNLVKNTSDGVYVWPAPNGRPDVNGFWLSTNANRTTWDAALRFAVRGQLWVSTALEQTLDTGSAIAILDHWLDRMLGYAPASQTYDALLADMTNPGGLMDALGSKSVTKKARAMDRLTALISTSSDFAYR